MSNVTYLAYTYVYLLFEWQITFGYRSLRVDKMHKNDRWVSQLFLATICTVFTSSIPSHID